MCMILFGKASVQAAEGAAAVVSRLEARKAYQGAGGSCGNKDSKKKMTSEVVQ